MTNIGSGMSQSREQAINDDDKYRYGIIASLWLEDNTYEFVLGQHFWCISNMDIVILH